MLQPGRCVQFIYLETLIEVGCKSSEKQHQKHEIVKPWVARCHLWPAVYAAWAFWECWSKRINNCVGSVWQNYLLISIEYFSVWTKHFHSFLERLRLGGRSFLKNLFCLCWTDFSILLSLYFCCWIQWLLIWYIFDIFRNKMDIVSINSFISPRSSSDTMFECLVRIPKTSTNGKYDNNHPNKLLTQTFGNHYIDAIIFSSQTTICILVFLRSF